jgi:hypothetical protein
MTGSYISSPSLFSAGSEVDIGKVGLAPANASGWQPVMKRRQGKTRKPDIFLMLSTPVDKYKTFDAHEKFGFSNSLSIFRRYFSYMLQLR